jgi:hypothetical protein
MFWFLKVESLHEPVESLEVTVWPLDVLMVCQWLSRPPLLSMQETSFRMKSVWVAMI